MPPRACLFRAERIRARPHRSIRHQPGSGKQDTQRNHKQNKSLLAMRMFDCHFFCRCHARAIAEKEIVPEYLPTSLKGNGIHRNA
jgi:hypothetical protein